MSSARFQVRSLESCGGGVVDVALTATASRIERSIVQACEFSSAP
jgi:hypothetical protein